MLITWEATVGSRAREYLRSEREGIFLGVFGSSFYCRIEGQGVLLFHKSSFGTIPFGIGCEDLESLMDLLKPVPDGVILCHDLELFLPATDIRLILKPHIPRFPLGMEIGGKVTLLSLQEISRNLADAEAILMMRKQGLLEGIFRLLSAVSGNNPVRWHGGIRDLWGIAPLDRLLRGNCIGDSASVEQALNRLIGLGPGLTPTMDDVLTGLVYLLAFLDRSGGQGIPAAGPLPGLISECCYKRTSEISGAYLLSAARGDAFSILEDVANSLLVVGGGHGLGRSIESLLAVGSDSGGNMLTGILLGVLYHCDSVKIISSVS